MARMTHVAVAAKLETTYGTDSVPVATVAAEALLFTQVELLGYEGQRVDRERVQPWHGNRGQPLTMARNIRLSGDVPFCSSGAAGTAPAWGKLLRACGMAEVLTASTRAEYAPVSIGQESLSAYWFMDGTRHRMTGSRGDFSIDLTAGQEPTISLNFTGLYNDPAAVTLPAPSFTAWRNALPPRSGITTLSIGGQTFPMRSLRYQHNNQILVRDMPSRNEVRITERSPSAEVTIEAPDGLSPTNFFQQAFNDADFNVVFSHGSTAGDIVELRMAQARILPGIRYGRDGDVATLTMNLLPRPSAAGNDEVLITAR
jgi:hypothetical protein